MELLSKKVMHHSSHGRRTRDDNRARNPFMRAVTAPTANSSYDSNRNRLFPTRARWHKKEENEERKGKERLSWGKGNRMERDVKRKYIERPVARSATAQEEQEQQQRV